MFSQKRSSQSGVVMVLFALMLPMCIIMMVLLFDMGKLYITRRQAQNLADMAANSGVSFLGKLESNDLLSVGDEYYINIKPAIKTIAQTLKILDVASVKNSDKFTHGEETHFIYELPEYNYDSLYVTAPGKSSLLLKIRRGLRCFAPDPDEPTSLKHYTLDLEAYGNHWCLANYVSAEVTISDSRPYFGQFIGLQRLSDIKRTAIAEMRPVPDSCGVPLCSLYDKYINYDSGTDSFVVDLVEDPPNCYLHGEGEEPEIPPEQPEE